MWPKPVLLLVLCFAPVVLSNAFTVNPISSMSSEPNNRSDDAGSGDPSKQKATSMSEGSTDGSEEEGSKSQKISQEVGRLEQLKQREATLARLLASVRREKLSALQSRPLTIGIVGFGRFGQFIARSFAKYGRVVATSRSDYTEICNGMGVNYIPLSDPASFMAEEPDVIVFAVSIMSFERTIRDFAPHIQAYVSEINRGGLPGPLVVDVLSVKEHPRQILLELLPKECDILCTHPMFGPDSGKKGWHGLNFVYERTRIDGVILDPAHEKSFHQLTEADADPCDEEASSFVELGSGTVHNVHESSEAHIEGMDRMERFLSIWEEEGCRMVALSCAEHDAYAANSQFITHLMGRILGSQGLGVGSRGLGPTPIDTRGFENVLKLVGNTMADSFDLFYGLYKYNQNSGETIKKLQVALEEVVEKLREQEESEKCETK